MEKGDRETHVRMSKRTQGHGPSTPKNEWTPRQRDTNVYLYINKQQQTKSTNRLQPNRPANRCRCLLVSAKGDIGWRCCQKHTGVPQSSASLPETCTKESCGAMENERERSVRIRSDSTSSSLRAMSPFSLLVSLLL